MSWYSKSYVLVPVLLSLSAFGQRIVFERTENPAASVVTNLSYGDRSVKNLDVQFKLPSMDIEKTRDGFDSVGAMGMNPIANLGRPELVTTGTLIAIPAGYTAKLVIKDRQTRELDSVSVKPAQTKFRCATNDDSFNFDSELYASNEVYPSEVASLEMVGDIQGLQIARVAINPVQMDMGKKKLLVSHSLDMTVQFEKVKAAKPVQLTPSLYKLAKSAVANSMGLGETVTQLAGPETMIVVTAETLKAAIAPLVQWKQAKGLDVKVVTYSEAGGTKEKVLEYLKAKYAEKKFSYLLMVGNKTTAPAFIEQTGGQQAASDWRFSLLSGASDRIPDLYYGRILADNEAEVATQVNRIIAYEKAPELEGWYHDGLTIASSEGSNPSDKEYAEQVQAALKAGTYKEFATFTPALGTVTAQGIADAINQSGRSWLAYFGHGSGTSWGTGSFSNTHVDALTSTKLPVIIDVACLNASWVNLPRPFGKAWMTGEIEGKAKGAVAFYGGSVSISWHEPAVMSVGIAKYHFEKKLETIGASVTAGQLHLFEKMGTGTNTLNNIKWYNLFGDPSMQVRTDAPKEYEVKSYVQTGANGLTVKVVATANGEGVSGLLASVGTSTRGVLAVGTTDAQGEAVLEISGVQQLEPSSLLTVTGYNANTYSAALKQ